MNLLLKALLQGDPGTAKTGSLAPLLNTGRFRVILCDFDHNPEALIANVLPQFRSRLCIIPFGDELRATDNGFERVNPISSVRRFTRFLFEGSPEAGRPSDWGPDTILALDSLSSFCDDAERLALQLNRGVTREGAHINVLGSEIETMLGMLMRKELGCHRVVVSHLKIIAPPAESIYGDETALQRKRKREIAEIQETGFFPYMPGNQVSRTIARFFNTALLYELDPNGARVIRTKPLKAYTIKVPVEVADPLPAGAGLLTIMEAFEQAGATSST